MQIGPVGPTAPIPFPQEGKGPAQPTLPAMQYYVLTSLVEVQNQTVASSMPPEEAPEAAPVAAVAAVGTSSPIEASLDALALGAELFALLKMSPLPTEKINAIKAKIALLTPQCDTSIIQNILKAPTFPSNLVGDKPTVNALLTWIKTNKNSIKDTLGDEGKCMDLIWIFALGMNSSDSEIKTKFGDVLNWTLGGGESIAQLLPRFVIAYFYHADKAKSGNEFIDDLKVFQMLTPRPISGGDFWSGTNGVCGRIWSDFKDCYDASQGKASPQWPSKWDTSFSDEFFVRQMREQLKNYIDYYY